MTAASLPACTGSNHPGDSVVRRAPWVCSLGVNPQLTIMALATRLAFGLLGKDMGSGPTNGEGRVLACPS